MYPLICGHFINQMHQTSNILLNNILHQNVKGPFTSLDPMNKMDKLHNMSVIVEGGC